jgi:hypothetical protein
LYIKGADIFFSTENLSKSLNIKVIATILAAIDLSLEHFLSVASKLLDKSVPF